jgi:hypothetical protein
MNVVWTTTASVVTIGRFGHWLTRLVLSAKGYEFELRIRTA